MENKPNALMQYLMKPSNWWLPLLIIFTVSAAGVIMIGRQTYDDAPPIPDYVDAKGNIVASHDRILHGQAIFQKYALMEYGTMFGDGALRGPDYTAEALHLVAEYMGDFYRAQPSPAPLTPIELRGIEAQVQNEIKENRYKPDNNQVLLTDAQAYAARKLENYYAAFFSDGRFKPVNYISDKNELADLSSFFLWGQWVCGVERPGEIYSYTHNWPYDPKAGNVPSSAVMMWSIIGSFALLLVLGLVLYFHGSLDKLSDESFIGKAKPLMTKAEVRSFVPTATQRASYKYFYVAMIVFLIQTLAGVLTVHDYVNFTTFFGYDLRNLLPVTITRSWHVQLSLLWIAACWIGASLFVAPIISPNEPKGQLGRVNLIFWLLVVLVGGSVTGIYAGPKGLFGDKWYLFGHQGWEFLEPGKVWQAILFLALIIWAISLFLALKPVMKRSRPWALPNWMVYSTSCIIILLVSGFVATPKTNFVIADFWRWCVVHMWAEAFFEVFTTVLVGYFMVLMGLVNEKSAIRVIYLATLLFLGSGLLGISHNFYWNAKPVATMALGSVFSTLQVIPLILLMLEAWRFNRLPLLLKGANADKTAIDKQFGLTEVFLFLAGVNFWNFLGAGVFGFIINLPIANYYEHGTYLTVNHGHAALMGVYGNLSLAAVLFCSNLLVKSESWNPKLIRMAFWSINIGLLLMLLLDLFPVGIMQFNSVLENGLWHARSESFTGSSSFHTFTWLRIIGGAIFFLGGVVPIVMAMVKGKLKTAVASK